MLKEGGPPPGGRWADLAILENVRYYKARHASAMLVFEAVEEAIRAVENERAETRAGTLIRGGAVSIGRTPHPALAAGCRACNSNIRIRLRMRCERAPSRAPGYP